MLACTHADNVQGTQLLVSIVLLNSDAVVCCLLYFHGDCLAGGLVWFDLVGFNVKSVVLFLRSTQQGGRCYRAVIYLCADGVIVIF